jgi:hypothetical protein
MKIEFYIIEELKQIPSTPHTIINPDYVLLDKAVDDDLQESKAFVARQLDPAEMEKMYDTTGTKSRHTNEHWKFVNYGSPKRNYHAAQICQNHLVESPVIINESLISDLRKALFPQPLPDTGVNDVFIDWLIPHTKMQLYGLIYFGAGFRQYFPGWFYPESYIIADYVALLQFIRRPHVHRENVHEDWFAMFREFQLGRLEFWRERLGMSLKVVLTIAKFEWIPMSTFETGYKKASLRFQSYPLHVARIQTINDQKMKRADFRLATRQKFAKSLGVDPAAYQQSLHEIILSYVGIVPSDRPSEAPKGSLDALKANNIVQGAFRIALTDEPARHLTFDESDGRPTLLVLSLQGMTSLFCIQHAGLFTYLPLTTLLTPDMPKFRQYS